MDHQIQIVQPTGPADLDARAVVTDAIQSLDIGLALWDENLRFVFGNKYWQEIFFRDWVPNPGDHVRSVLKELIADGIWEVPHGSRVDAFVNHLIRLLRSYATDVQIDLPDGRVFNGSVHKTGLGGFLVSFRDISSEVRSRDDAERQRAKTERANTRLRDALESIGEGFALFDRDDKLILANDLYKSANPAAAHLMTFGRPRKEIIEAMTNGGDIVGVENWIDSYECETAVGDTSSPRRYEVHHANGRVFMASRGRTAEGGCTITWLDITDSKNTEARARALAHDAMEALDEGFALFDADLCFVFCNRMFADIVLGGQENTPERGALFADHMGAFYDRKLSVDANTTPRDQYLKDAREFVTTYHKRAEFEFLDGRLLQMSSHQTELGGYLITARDITHERALEAERLRAKTRELEAVAQAMQVLVTVVAIYDADFNFVMANRGYFEMWHEKPGIPRAVPGENLKAILERLFEIDYLAPPEGMDKAQAINMLVAEGRNHSKNVPLETPDGSYLGHFSPTGDGGYLIEFTDLTEQKALEKERRRAAERELEVVTDTMQSLITAIALFDADLNFVMGNHGYFEMWYTKAGIDPAEPGESLTSILERMLDVDYFVLPDGVDHAMAHDLMMQSVKTFTKNVPLETRAGSFVGHVSPAGNGGYLVEFSDITEQKALEEERRMSEARALARVTDTVEALDIALVLLDDELKFVFGNEKLNEFYHRDIPRSEVGEPIQDSIRRLVAGGFYKNSSSLTEDELLERLLQRIHNIEKEFETLTADGRVFRGSVHRTQDDGRVISFTDITEQRRAEAELERQREITHQNEKLSAMGELLAGVAHELNNPLSIVVGYAMMMQNAVSDPKLKRQVDNIAQAAERCSRIVKAFLAMARQRPAELKRCSLNELLMASLDMVGHRLRSAGIEVEMDLDPDLPDVDADEDQIIQVLTNLIVNAEQALAWNTGTKSLGLRSFYDAVEDRAVVCVADNGPGISSEMKSRIFEPFFTTKDVGSGTGIGLAFCHRVVDSHGGRMTVQSEQGRGAQFYIRLDTAKGTDVRIITESNEAEGSHGRILVVDDETGVAELIGEVLKDAGYRIEIRNSGAEALELLRTQRFDAVLSDLKMPGLDGPAFYARLADIDPALASRTGFVTGDTLSRDAAAFLASTRQPYLEKPVTPPELLNLVSDLMERRRSEP